MSIMGLKLHPGSRRGNTVPMSPPLNEDSEAAAPRERSGAEPVGLVVSSISIAIATFVLLGVIALIYNAALTALLGDSTSRAEFGDSFGAAGVLVSALAFGAFLVSLHLQRREHRAHRTELGLQREELVNQRLELVLQREEMALQREELAASRKAQEASVAVQTRATAIQRFGGFVDFHTAIVARHHNTTLTSARRVAACYLGLRPQDSVVNEATGVEAVRTIGNYYNELGILIRNWPEDVGPELRNEVIDMVRGSALALYAAAVAWGNTHDTTNGRWGENWGWLEHFTRTGERTQPERAIPSRCDCQECRIYRNELLPHRS